MNLQSPRKNLQHVTSRVVQEAMGYGPQKPFILLNAGFCFEEKICSMALWFPKYDSAPLTQGML